MVTNNYHDNQDIPNLDDPETALALFQQQQAALATVKEEADADLAQIEQSLGKTLQFAQEKGLTKLEQRVNKQWQLAQMQHRRVTHLTSALDGAGTAIKALHQQRDAVTAEFSRLVDAIEKGDETHPQLRGYAQDIRSDEAEAMYNDWDYMGYEYDFEFVYENYCERIGDTWGHIINSGLASRVLDAVIGDLTLTDIQRAALVSFIETLAGPDETADE